MVFSSPIFLFLPITLLTYYLIRRELRNIVLLIASLFFYAWGEPKYILVMLSSTLFNYIFGLLIEKYRTQELCRKFILVISIICNIGMLVYFKYFNFFINNINFFLAKFSVPIIQIEHVHLPIGISFFTFQALSYVIDVYRKDTDVQKNPFELALYISLFPQLIAGPIVRYHDVAHQIKFRESKIDKIARGINRFIIGLSKKVIIANTLGCVADKIFALDSSSLTTPLSWLGIISYSLQIYYDFSGYSDMAIGLGNMFGFTFLENFNYPYISRSIQEFWRRWHISLSSWFRDYLYIPLGGSRGHQLKVYRNLLIVFFTTGLWHGASWNFVIWGLFHGLFLMLERTNIVRIQKRGFKGAENLYTLLIVMVGWVFFRAETLGDSVNFIIAMFGGAELTNYDYPIRQLLNNEVILVLILAVMGSSPIYKKIYELLNKYLKNRGIVESVENVFVFSIFVISMSYLASSTYNPFIYFRF